ncbi:MAG: class I SAM-dependent methyltransferase, partial [Caulobacteraceae bacterium]
MATNPMLRARSQVASDASRQEQNRQWWERMPMTYARWEDGDRSTTRERVIADFLAGNPFFAPEYFQRFAGKDVLEIGCGAGPATALFAEGGARVTAIDITEAGVELTRRHTEGLNVTVKRMDAERLEFPDASFDHAFAWGVLHHSDHSETAFAQIARVLRPGGTALVMV